MRRGSTAKPPSPDSPPRSLARTSGPWRKLAEMNGFKTDCFNERVWPDQDAEGIYDRTSSVGLNAPGPRGSWTEGTPHFHSACYEGALSGIRGAGGQTLAHKQRLAPVGRSQVPPARSKGPRGACVSSPPSRCETSSCDLDRRPWVRPWRMPWSDISPKGSFASSRTGRRSRPKRISSGPATRTQKSNRLTTDASLRLCGSQT
jgi:hypothetical protein